MNSTADGLGYAQRFTITNNDAMDIPVRTSGHTRARTQARCTEEWSRVCMCPTLGDSHFSTVCTM